MCYYIIDKGEKKLQTTICYIEKDGKYLMLHRNKKKIDINKDKWIGVGGKFEKGESPEECVIREVKEETGLILKSYKLRGVITYNLLGIDDEYMYIFTSDDFEGELTNCNEGDLEWVEKDKIYELNLWEADKIFLKKLNDDDNFFTMKCVYDKDKLISYCLNEY